MGRKTAEDLEPDPASIGGAMSQWPRRTLNWVCRDMRVNAADKFVADTLIEREVRDLRELRKLAVDVDIEARNLHMKEKALDKNDAKTIMRAIQTAYEGKFDGDMNQCPFEEQGLDKACWACPVAGNALDQLEDMVGRQSELEAD